MIRGLGRIIAAAAILTVFCQHTVKAQDSPAGQTLPINGMQMYYEDYGRGEPLVMLHGFTGSSQGWHPFIEEFSAHYRLIIPDLRGHGRTNNPSGKFTHRQSALDIYALLDKLGIDKFRGIGSSTGGMTLIHMATQQPERVEAMILLGATIYFGEQAREIMRGRSPDSIPPERMEQMRKTHKLGDEQIRSLLRQFYDFKDSYDDMNFTPPFLSTIKARTLIMHGDRDQFFPVSIPVEMYNSIPHSYLWIVPNGGHSPINADNNALFRKLALEFLAGEWEKK